MTTYSLRLASILDVAGVTRVLNALHAVPGVNAAEATPGQSVIDIRFDQDRTSVQELNSVLAKAGYPQTARHADGKCCGSCGG